MCTDLLISFKLKLHTNTNVLFYTLRLSETKEDQEKEEFMARANAVIEQLQNIGYEEHLIRAAMASCKSLDAQIIVEVLNREGNKLNYKISLSTYV